MLMWHPDHLSTDRDFALCLCVCVCVCVCVRVQVFARVNVNLCSIHVELTGLNGKATNIILMTSFGVDKKMSFQSLAS